ncbi:MAG TPA: AraC family transcriptional regulator, partial [Anseongella sp.]|nr:AraC family transcriptional regulator [Anseongella sp.]
DAIDCSIRFLKQHISQSLTLKEIADHVHLSVSHFSGLFQKKTGFSPIEYFNHLKMQKACQLLHFTDLRIYEVAARTGIGDPYYFSRVFKENMGVSPKEYRQRWQLSDDSRSVHPGFDVPE